ncbi:MAG: AraC family transcriptional regulator [Bacteroidales bacterium]|nr:MAG: AraC family transcriptional regulator [Bacteroidales bacterium]
MTGSEQTLKSYYERINVVMQYIHNHLDEKLDLDYLASLSFYSPFHFHRIMRAYLGESLGSHIQRTRVGFAAQFLRVTDMPIAEIALKAGYDTPASFNKAFRKRFGISPRKFREDKDYQLPFYEPIKHQISMENLTKQPEIRVINDFKVIYVTAIGAYGDHNTESAWKTVCDFAGQKNIFGPNAEFLGISYDDPKITEPERCRYEACITIKSDVRPDGKVGVKTISGGRYAVFKLVGPFTLLAPSYDYIFGHWMPENGAELRDEPGFEKYLKSPDSTPPDELETEIWVPIK